MFPPVHPGVAYLLYAGWRRLAADDLPGEGPTLALLVGAVLPDLIDQPLARLADVPSTRTLGHSLLFVVPVAVAVVFAVRRSSRTDALAGGFAVGALSHPLADALWPALLGIEAELGFLLWPLTHSPDYEGTKPLLELGSVTVTTLWVELPLLALAVLLWLRDGRPGLRALRRE